MATDIIAQGAARKAALVGRELACGQYLSLISSTSTVGSQFLAVRFTVAATRPVYVVAWSAKLYNLTAGKLSYLLIIDQGGKQLGQQAVLSTNANDGTAGSVQRRLVVPAGEYTWGLWLATETGGTAKCAATPSSPTSLTVQYA